MAFLRKISLLRGVTSEVCDVKTRAGRKCRVNVARHKNLDVFVVVVRNVDLVWPTGVTFTLNCGMISLIFFIDALLFEIGVQINKLIISLEGDGVVVIDLSSC